MITYLSSFSGSARERYTQYSASRTAGGGASEHTSRSTRDVTRRQFSTIDDDMPQVSVIVPAYNSADTILKTLDSVLKQTVSDLQVLIIDDGSTDDTVALVSSLNHPKIEVCSYPNAGTSTSRNRGIDRAKGEYISFIDADDLWHPQKLELQLEALQRQPDAGVAYSWTDFIDEKGEFLHQGSYLKVNGEVLPYILLFNFIESGSNFLVCRQALETVGGFDKTMPPAEDWDLGIRLAKQYPFVCVPQPHVFYRKLTRSQSTNIKRLEMACLRAIEENFYQVSTDLKHLKSASLGNIYKYLLMKCFENSQQKDIGVTIVNFLQKAISNDPRLLANKRLVLAIFLKGMILSMLPTPTAQRWNDRVDRKIYPTSQLYRFYQTQPF